jgi:hypothetical protein
MTILLYAEVLALLIILGLIYSDRKNNTQYKRRRFYVSFFTLLVIQAILYLAGFTLSGVFIKKEAQVEYFFIAIIVVSIPATLFFSRWYVNKY